MRLFEYVRQMPLMLTVLFFVTSVTVAQNPTTTISMWHIATPSDPFHPVLQGAIDRFNAAHPDIQIEARAVENANYKEEIEHAVATGQQPDIFQTWGGGTLQAFVEEGAVRPIDELRDNAAFLPAALAPSTFDDQHYAVPANLAGVFLWYSRDLFTRHNVEVPRTWEQLMSACRQFRNIGITPIGLGNQEQWPGGLWYNYIALRIGAEAGRFKLFEETRWQQFSEGIHAQVESHIREAVEAGCFGEDYNSTTFPDAQQRLASGQVAMQLQGDWNWGGLKNANPQAETMIGVLPFPLLEADGGSIDDFVGGTGQSFAISADAPPQAAGALIEMLGSQAFGNAVAEAGFIPALQGYQDYIPDPIVREMANMLEDARYIQLYYDQLLPPDFAETYLHTTYQLFDQSTTTSFQGRQVNQSLAQLASGRELPIGTAVSVEPLRNDPEYAAVLQREFNMITPEVAMKWSILRPDPDTFTFDDADTIVNFALENGMQVRGHTLIWHRQLPPWLEYGSFSRDELLVILHEHIITVVSRYKGKIAAWDVVNEAVNEDGSLRDSIWLRTIGPEYIDYAFQWAHEADRNALLFYNDYDAEGSGPKSDAVYELVKGMIERGVPVHGVGYQMHISLAKHPPIEEVRQNMNRLAALGLEVQITEMDVAIQDGSSSLDERFVQQAQLYGDIANLCVQEATCTAFVVWGFTDLHTWIPQATGNADQPLIFDTNYRPKPAYDALANALES